MDSRSVLREPCERLAVLMIRCMKRLKAPDAGIGALWADVAELAELLQVCAWAAADGDVSAPAERMREAAAAKDTAALAEVLSTQIWPLVTAWLMPNARV